MVIPFKQEFKTWWNSIQELLSNQASYNNHSFHNLIFKLHYMGIFTTFLNSKKLYRHFFFDIIEGVTDQNVSLICFAFKWACQEPIYLEPECVYLADC